MPCPPKLHSAMPGVSGVLWQWPFSVLQVCHKNYFKVKLLHNVALMILKMKKKNQPHYLLKSSGVLLHPNSVGPIAIGPKSLIWFRAENATTPMAT